MAMHKDRRHTEPATWFNSIATRNIWCRDNRSLPARTADVGLECCPNVFVQSKRHRELRERERESLYGIDFCLLQVYRRAHIREQRSPAACPRWNSITQSEKALRSRATRASNWRAPDRWNVCATANGRARSQRVWAPIKSPHRSVNRACLCGSEKRAYDHGPCGEDVISNANENQFPPR